MTILGIDIGGTFTDFVLLQDDGRISIHKLATTPEDPAQALLAGIKHLGTPDLIIHGTTIATNALLERRGAVTALLTTAGFADVLVIGRGTRAALYDLDMQQSPSIVPASLRIEIPERIASDGTVLHPLDESVLVGVVQQLHTAGVEAVAICFLHSYRNPRHEQRIATQLAAMQQADGSPRIFVCVSSDVLPEYREYERTSTTVVNAYVAPVLDRYLNRIEQELEQQQTSHGYPPALHIMASDGGSMSTRSARKLAARTTLSGPAGGVVGARYIAEQAGFRRIMSFDMGGTSTDVALCDDALPQTTESSVGGLPVRFPAISIHTVGAGGGSLARIDDGGALRVGPQSAGADPGPACYGHDNLPTVTDANLVLGRLRAERFLGGDMPLDVSRAEKAIAPIAQQLGMVIPAVALGIVRVANAAMERALRTISVERGIDPRDFTLVAFGGAGPLHAAYLADGLDMQRVLVPRYPGVLSALGMLVADMSRDYIHFVAQPLDEWSPQALSAAMMGLAEQARADFIQEARATTGREALPDEEEWQMAAALRGEFTLDLRYAGQSHEINTPLMVWEGLQPALPEREEVVQHFHQLHQQYSGYTLPDRPIEVVALRLKCVAEQQRPPLAAGSLHPQLPEPPGQPACADERVQVLLHAESTRPITTALYERSKLRSGDFIAAPGIVVQLDTTCVIPYGWRARVDRYDNLLMTRV